MVSGIIGLTCLAVVILAVVWMDARVRSVSRSVTPPPAPLTTSDCTCKHAKSYHDGGKGACRQFDTRMVYTDPAKHGANPPCNCQIYVPKEVPALPPAPPVPAGHYDPTYTAFLQWWTDHFDAEGNVKP